MFTYCPPLLEGKRWLLSEQMTLQQRFVIGKNIEHSRENFLARVRIAHSKALY